MKQFQATTAAALVAFSRVIAAQSSIVSGTAFGFAEGATGGGDAAAVYPSTIEDLIAYLTDPNPQNIVIEGTFDFVGSEGTETYPACDSYSCTPSNGGQALLNTLEGCGDSALYDVTLDKAGMQGINVASDKTLVGLGTDTVLNGKGLRFVGVSNIIVQNIEITNLNPQYVWGGDAFVFSDTSLIWVDHVTTSSPGRQHYSFGQEADSAITISNSFINGQTDYSATCDGHTYWVLELVGSGDQITFSGRSQPSLSLSNKREYIGADTPARKLCLQDLGTLPGFEWKHSLPRRQQRLGGQQRPRPRRHRQRYGPLRGLRLRYHSQHCR